MIRNYNVLLRILPLFLLMAFTRLSAQSSIQTFTYTGTIVNYTVPYCVSTITMEAWGAQGGSIPSYPGGLGAYMSGVFTVTPGQVLRVLVGGQGVDITNTPAATGGGGGSFVALVNGTNTPTPMLVAGGGGGRRNLTTGPALNSHATIGNNAMNSFDNSGAGGTGGNGGLSGEPSGNGTGGPGGGFFTNGGPCGTLYPPTPGYAFINGGMIAPTCSPFTSGYSSAGGFGGGGGGCWCYRGTPGGGGGYSGGGTGVNDNAGGGGGSYNSGTSQLNSAQTNTGNGMVRLTFAGSPTITASASSTAMCSGSSINLNASNVSTYTWVNVSNNPTITVSPTANTIYTISGTNSVGCISTKTIAITVNTAVPSLSVVTSAPTNTVCLGKTVTVTASGALSYVWSNGIPNGGSFIPSVTASYTVTGANGCGTSSFVTTITVAPLPIAAVSSPSVKCANQAAQLTAVSTATTYTWSPGGVNSPSTTVSPTVTTVYTVVATDGTCSGVTQVTLSVNPIPTIGIVSSGTTMICEGQSVTLTASGALTITWTPGGSNSMSVVANPTVSTLYTAAGTNTFGCVSSLGVPVIVNAAPNVNLQASGTFICENDIVTLTASGSAHTYVWSTSAQGISTTVTPVATTVYSVTGTNTLTTCQKTQTVEITVFKPVISISSSTAACLGVPVTFTASGADAYQWSNGMQFSSITESPAVTTTYTLSTLTDSNGITCPATNTVQLTINPNPTITVAATRSVICKKELSTITASGAVNYSWSTAGTPTTAAIVVNPTVSVPQNYVVTGTNSFGCTGSATMTIKVNACTGIRDQNGAMPSVKVFPNPSTGVFQIQGEREMNLQVVNELGQVVKYITLNAKNAYTETVRDLPAAIYFVTGESNHEKFVIKIIITE
jgi:hypothetical protein